MVFISLNTFYPTFLSSVRNYSIAEASTTTSLVMIAVIIAAPLAGILLDKIGSWKLGFTLPLVLVAIMMLFPFVSTGGLIPGWLFVIGIIAGAIDSNFLCVCPRDHGQAATGGIGMAVLTVGQNLGMVVGPIIFGTLVESSGWVVAGYWLIPVALLGLLAGWLVKARELKIPNGRFEPKKGAVKISMDSPCNV